MGEFDASSFPIVAPPGQARAEAWCTRETSEVETELSALGRSAGVLLGRLAFSDFLRGSDGRRQRSIAHRAAAFALGVLRHQFGMGAGGTDDQPTMRRVVGGGVLGVESI